MTLRKSCLFGVAVLALASPTAAETLPQFDSREAQLEAGIQAANDAYRDQAPMEHALELLHPLAEDGCAKAQEVLGNIYSWDEPRRSIQWIRKAAEQGNPGAQVALASAYEGASPQSGLPRRNFEEAALWYQRAAEQGDPRAMSALASYHLAGRGGLERSDIEGYKWYLLIVPRVPRQNPENPVPYLERSRFKHNLAALAERMTKLEVILAERRASAWERAHHRIRHLPDDAVTPFPSRHDRVEDPCDR